MKTTFGMQILILGTVFLFSSCDNSNTNPNPPSGGGLSDLPNCPDGKQIFSVPPVPLNQIVGWEPLGHMGPVGHTFPTDHQYLYVRNPDTISSIVSVPLYAPADIRITAIWRGLNVKSGQADYSIFFQPCGDLSARFGHVGSVSAALSAAAGPIDSLCTTYEPSPGFPNQQCQTHPFAYYAKAGEQIGTTGDSISFALDWWLQDRRVTPIHYTNETHFNIGGDFNQKNIVPASEYFTADVSAQVAAKIGRYDGKLLRTVAPIGGSIAVDVDSTARGYWFNPTQPYPPESYQAALAPDYLTPDTTQDFSIGLSQPNVTSGTFGSFKPVSSGTVNRAFEAVRADGKIYCYEVNPNYGVILLQLTNPTTLRLEIRSNNTTCAANSPYQFSANTFDYKR